MSTQQQINLERNGETDLYQYTWGGAFFCPMGIIWTDLVDVY